MSFHNNFITLCGGKNSGSFSKIIKRFDLQTLSWDNDAFITRQMKVGRSGVSCVVMTDPTTTKQSADASPLVTIGGTMLVCGGNGLPRASAVVEMYSFLDNRSVHLKPLNEPRSHCGSVYLPFRNQVRGFAFNYTLFNAKEMSSEHDCPSR